MKLKNCIITLCIFWNSVSFSSCWQYFTSFTDLIMESSEKEKWHFHSEYIYGECNRKDIKFYTYTSLDHLQVLGKPIVRGWIDIPRIPVCIKLRAYSHFEDRFRNTAFSFQLCVPRITYCHTHRRHKYHYFELYVPSDFYGGMNWKIFYFGPTTMEWG